MKIKHLFWLCLVALVGCTDSWDDEPALQQGLEIQVDGGINQQYHSRVDDGGFCGGDQIGLYGVNYTADNSVPGTLEDKGNQVDNVRYTYDEANFKWTSSVSAYYKDVNTHIDLYAYYPYGSPSSVTAYEFEVAKDQNNDGDYGASDFLWAKAENVAPSENRVKLHFGHKMSCVNVILAEGNGFAGGEFGKLSKSVLVKNTIHTSTVDLSTGKVTPTGNSSNEGIVMMEASDGFRAIVVPQTMKATTVLFAITVDGMSYHYKKDVAFTYEAGKQSKFTITVNKKASTGTYEFVLTDTEIVDWIADIETHGGEARQYFVVNQETPGTLGDLIKANGKNPNKIKNLKISGNVDARDFYFMRDNMELLQAVNMKESKINEYIDAVYYKANEIPENAFRDKEITHFAFPEKLTKIGKNVFSGTLLSGALIIPDGVTEIGDGAFAGTPILSLLLPSSVKKLGHSVFLNCKSLTGTLNLPESLEEFGSRCFEKCNFDGILIIPSRIEKIPNDCFAGCKFTGDLVIPDNVKVIEYGAFQVNGNLNGRLILPDGLTEIGTYAFSDCAFQGELVIPKQLKIIESDVFEGCNFSSLILPEGLLKICGDAFRDNKRLYEKIIFPESLVSIEEYAFSGCNTIQGIVLPESLQSIQAGAFLNCYGITSIICHAKFPPVLGSSVFNGVPKDNFTLEVPGTSLMKYETTTGWNEFRRISAYHDFSISRSLMRSLNAGYSGKYILRAPSEQKWCIEEKPEWVVIEPMNGVGKTEVTITVNPMSLEQVGTFDLQLVQKNGSYTTETHKGRAGKIVFLLNDKDYRSTMTVEQYDYAYGDGDVITHQTAKEGAGVNLVFIGDCFDAKDIATGKYVEGINQAVEHFFDIEPYKTYRDYFNVYTIFGMSLDSGVGTVNTVRDAKFGSQYTIHGGVALDEGITFDYACKAQTVSFANIKHSLVVMIENTQDYGGVTYMWSDGSAIAVCPMSADLYPYDFRGIVQHEAGGHGFGKLADEYIYNNAFIQSCSCENPHVKEFTNAKSWGWYDNLSLSGNINEVPWSHLIFHQNYSDRVDMFEGGFYHTRGVYRSEDTSCMNNNIPYFSTISRQSIVERIMNYAGEEFLLVDFYDNDVRKSGGRSTQQSWDVTVNNFAGASKQHAPKIMSGKPRIGK